MLYFSWPPFFSETPFFLSLKLPNLLAVYRFTGPEIRKWGHTELKWPVQGCSAAGEMWLHHKKLATLTGLAVVGWKGGWRMHILNVQAKLKDVSLSENKQSTFKPWKKRSIITKTEKERGWFKMWKWNTTVPPAAAWWHNNLSAIWSASSQVSNETYFCNRWPKDASARSQRTSTVRPQIEAGASVYTH